MQLPLGHILSQGVKGTVSPCGGGFGGGSASPKNILSQRIFHLYTVCFGKQFFVLDAYLQPV